MSPRDQTPTTREMLGELLDLTTGLGVMLMPLLLLAVPGLVLLLPLVIPVIPLVILAAPFMLIRSLRARPNRARSY